MGKIVRYILLGIGALGIFGAFRSMFAEPFAAEMLRRLGIDTSTWVDPMLNLLSHPAATLVSGIFIGTTIGAWLHWAASRYDKERKKEVVAFGNYLRELGVEMSAKLQIPTSERKWGDHPHRMHAAFDTCRRMGMPAPDSRSSGQIKLDYAYAVGSRLGQGLVKEARTEAKRLMKGATPAESLALQSPPSTEEKMPPKNHLG